MKILVTGASGFIGNYFVKKFKKYNNIVAITHKRKANLSSKKNVDIIKRDLTKKFLSRIQNLDLIIHCANYTPANHRNSKALIKKNNLMIKNLIDFANLNDVNKIVYLSSMAVYKIRKKKNFIVKENSTLNYDNDYSISKINDEKILKRWQKKNFSRKLLILRLPGVIGLNSHGNFISNLKKKIIGKKYKFIKVFNLYKNFNNALHVDCLFNFVNEYVKKFKFPFLVLNLASKKPEILNKLLIMIIKRLNKKKSFIDIGSDNKSFNINISKSMRYGFNPFSTKYALMKYFSIKKNSKN